MLLTFNFPYIPPNLEDEGSWYGIEIPPCIGAAFGGIVQVLLHCVGFAFENQVTICLHSVAVLDGFVKPFEIVPDEEANVSQLLLLESVDIFVILRHFGQFALIYSAEDDAKEIGCPEGIDWDIFVVYNLHCI